MYKYINNVKSRLSFLKDYIENIFQDDKRQIDDEINDKIINENKKSIEIVSKFTDIGLEIYKNLNLSVISGSYIKGKQFERKIEKCRNIVNDIRKSVPEAESHISNQIDNLLCLSLYDSLNNYQYLTHNFQVKISTPDKLFLLTSVQQPPNNKQQSESTLSPLIELFQYNIEIAFIDTNFSLNIDILRELLSIFHELKEKKYEGIPFTQILIDKCTLLIYKFKLRYDDKDLFNSLVISHDFTDEEVKPEELKTQYVEKFQKIIDFIYNENEKNNVTLFRSHISKIENPQNYTDYFIGIRYYAKIEENINRIDQLIGKFEESHKNKKLSHFDRYSYNISINYLYNNKISFIVKHNPKLEDINTIFEQIKQLQIRTGIKNYFPFYKIACYYSNYIENHIEDIVEIKKLIPYFENAINMVEKNLVWTDIHTILPFQPNYNSCCIKQHINQQEITIFMASAYIIPINYEYYKKELVKLQNDFQTYKTVLKMHKFAGKAEEAYQEAKESQKNNIQILSVFSALVIFAAGSIQIFKATTLREAIIIMLSLAYGLCLFSIVIWFIVSYKKVKMTVAHWILIVVLVLGFVISCCAIFSDWGNKNIAQKPTTQIESFSNLY